jgi:uncharacterized membrane protein/glutaredoxin
LFGLALVGMGLTAYLTYNAWQGSAVAGCVAGSACDVVLSSRWSTLFGLPTSLWGFFTYALLGAIAWSKRADNQWKAGWIVSLFGLGYSSYLTSVSYLYLEATCPYCLTSLALMAAIFVAVTLQRPKDLPGFVWSPWLAKSLGGAAVVVLALHLHYAGFWGTAPRPEDPWIRGLAEHLTQVDAKIYGASWCPHCNDQKELFGSSARRVPYVECSPSGPRAPTAAVCKENNVQSYPTWIIDGQRFVGTQSLDALARYSNYNP